MANPRSLFHYLNPSKGSLRLFSQKLPDSARNLWDAPNVLLQKTPADSFKVTTRMSFTPNAKLLNEKAGLVMMGMSYAGIGLKLEKEGMQLVRFQCVDASRGKTETEQRIMAFSGKEIYLRLEVRPGARCRFSYSTDGQRFTDAGLGFTAVAGRWKGAKMGLFCSREAVTNDAGYADFDWFRVEAL